ncbi:TPA: hypothetical protein AB5C23_001299 [Vibrio cholerae]
MTAKGIESVKAGFSKITEDIDTNKTDAAIYAILSEGVKVAQMMVPIDTGTLANSQYAPIIEHTAGKTTGYVGYTADYAGYVHEMPGKLKGLPRPQDRGDFWAPDAEPKFLTKGFEEIEPQIPAILERMYRV